MLKTQPFEIRIQSLDLSQIAGPPIKRRKTRVDLLADDVSSTENEIVSIDTLASCASPAQSEALQDKQDGSVREAAPFSVEVMGPRCAASRYRNVDVPEDSSRPDLVREDVYLRDPEYKDCDAYGEDEFRTIFASSFVLYATDDHRLVTPSHLFGDKRQSNSILMDCRPSPDAGLEGSHQINDIVVDKLSIEPLLDLTVHTIKHVYVQSSRAASHNTWYELIQPASDYAELWHKFMWQANLAKHVSDFLNACSFDGKYDIRLADFTSRFGKFLEEHHGHDQEFRTWQAHYGKSDYRQQLVLHWKFIWSVIGDLPLAQSPVFRELACSSLREHTWSPHDLTVVTPYVYECFEHIFGRYLRVVQSFESYKKQEMSHVEIHERVPSSPKTQTWTPRDIKVGDFVWFTDAEENSQWRQRTKVSLNKSRSGGETTLHPNDEDAHAHREIMYITEVVARPTHQEPDRVLYRGLHCYLPGTWHTQLDLSHYAHVHEEIFLSDHCNCPEEFDEHRLATFEEIAGKCSVNLYGDACHGHEYFCRTLYLHREGNFQTLSKAHLDPQAAQLPCECRTASMKARQANYFSDFAQKYQCGETVLIDRDTILLEPYIVHGIDHDETKVVFRKLLRRQYHAPESTNRLNSNEVILTDEFIERRGISLKRVERRCGLWYLPIDADLPNQLQLNGSGEQFYFTYKLDNGGHGLFPCSFEDFKALKLESIVSPLAKLRGLDLFCGAGNLGEGIRDAGVVQYAAIIDLFSEALHSYQANHVNLPCDDPSFESEFYLGSVNAFLKADMRREHIEPIDFLVGGSPCQGFSAVNVLKNSDTSLRNCSLVSSFASYIDFYRPKYAVLENVRGLSDNVLVDGRLVNVHRQLLAMAVGIGYQVRTYSNHAWHHGSGQSRERIFVVFAAKGLALPEQPEQSHYSAATSRRGQSLLRNPHNEPYHNPKHHDSPKAFHPIVCRDIWGDLPPTEADTFDVALPDHRTAGALNVKTRWFSQYTGYAANTTRPSRYAGQKEALTSSLMHDAHALPAALAKYYPKHTNGSKSYSRTNPDKLVPTVLTTLNPQAKFGSAVLHYEQPRCMTILEAKRAQGFLDNDVLLGAPNAIIKQIGNSVSRHASYAIGLTIRAAMLKNEKTVSVYESFIISLQAFCTTYSLKFIAILSRSFLPDPSFRVDPIVREPHDSNVPFLLEHEFHVFHAECV